MLTTIQNPYTKNFTCQSALQSGVVGIYYLAGVKMGSNPKALKALATCYLVSSLLLYAMENCICSQKPIEVDRSLVYMSVGGIAVFGMLFGLPLIGFIAGASWKTQLISFVFLNISTLSIQELGPCREFSKLLGESVDRWSKNL